MYYLFSALFPYFVNHSYVSKVFVSYLWKKNRKPWCHYFVNFYWLFYFSNIYFKCIERHIYGSLHLNLALLHNTGSYQCFFEHANPLLADNDSPETSSGNFLETYFVHFTHHSFIHRCGFTVKQIKEFEGLWLPELGLDVAGTGGARLDLLLLLLPQDPLR